MKRPVLFWRNTAKNAAGAWEAETAQGSFGRLWGVFMNARVAIAAGLVILQEALQALGTPLNHWTLPVCIVYLGATLAVRLWAHPRPPGCTFDGLWVGTIGVDVMAFSLLNFFQASPLNYTPLFALPVLLASVLGPIVLACGTAAGVTLLLLADAAWSSVQGSAEVNARLLQAALSGSGFFLVALLANQLAVRLAREETLAKQSQSAARMQIQVNELVVATLAEGVLVIDGNGDVRSANPAARRLLGAQELTYPAPFKLAAQTAWQPLAELMQHTFAQQSAHESHVSLVHPGLNARRLQVRSRLTDSRDGPHESMCVMFLEDLREMEARVRIEKLAAMGRLSAAVAHEIRNPLAAISQANALLEEDLQDAGQRQLTGMIGQNARRLAKIVDEVLNISRAQQEIPAPQSTSLRLDEAARRIANDWARQNAASGHLRIFTDSANAEVDFDDDHLRRLMLNLLDNALRYTSGAARGLEVSTQLVAPGQARLAVWSDGQPLEETVQAHLFEPFFSSESRSTGLGLYICRELCERYGAQIGYQRVLREKVPGNEFFVLFQAVSQHLRAELPSMDTVLV
ncbi:MAG: integral rane sensor signal transduction histidine kinase [Polaromonas sp.]|nr:integral rane sensor signal transduction histidine kinase [Polaromonas sp.]